MLFGTGGGARSFFDLAPDTHYHRLKSLVCGSAASRFGTGVSLECPGLFAAVHFESSVVQGSAIQRNA